jgi:hypothetical protein
MMLLLDSHTTHIGNLNNLKLANGHDVIYPALPGHNITLASTDRLVFSGPLLANTLMKPDFKYQL